MSILNKNLVVWLILFFTASFLINTSKNLVRFWQRQQDLDKKRDQLEALMQTNEDLKERLITLDEGQLEKLVRDKLGMVKPGETVVVLPEDIKQIEESIDRLDTENKRHQNWQKWLYLFI